MIRNTALLMDIIDLFRNSLLHFQSAVRSMSLLDNRALSRDVLLFDKEAHTLKQTPRII